MAKIGDLVQTIFIGNRFPKGKIVKIFRMIMVGKRHYYDCCDDDGNCALILASHTKIYKLNKKDMKAMKKAVLSTAKDLLKANNTVTTLEIKTQLLRDYPYFYWTQDTVSKYMAEFAGDGLFTFTDNGTYRTYSLVSTATGFSGLNGGINGVAGVVGYCGTSKTRRAKTMKVSKKVTKKSVKPTTSIVSRALAPAYLTRSDFQGVVLANGSFIDVANIKRQKKSISGYVTPKLHSIKAMKVGGKTVTIV